MRTSEASYEELQEIIKDIMVLLLSGANRPIKSKIHLQKELFLLVKSFPKFQKLINFKAHFYGPFSENIESVLENHINEFFEVGNHGIGLTTEGNEYSQQVLSKLSSEKKDKLMRTIKMIRSIYDNLTESEFMFLIYMTYGLAEKSERVNDLLKNRKKLAEELYKKGVITYKKYKELLGEDIEAYS